MEVSVSVTTRPPRPGEEEGVHYFFIDQDRYDEMVEKGELLEYARLREVLRDAPRAGGQGAVGWTRCGLRCRLARNSTAQAVHSRGSGEHLHFATVDRGSGRWLRTRAQDSEEVIQSRMSKAADEISHWPEYDYVVINEDLDRATDEVRAILVAERLKRERQVDLPAFVRSLSDAG